MVGGRKPCLDDMGRQWWDGWEKKAPHFGGNGMLEEQHLFRNDARRRSLSSSASRFACTGAHSQFGQVK